MKIANVSLYFFESEFSDFRRELFPRNFVGNVLVVTVAWLNQFQKCKYAPNPKLSWTYSIVVADRVLSKTMIF